MVLDLSGRSSVTDMFVLVTVRNLRQSQAVAEEVRKAARESGSTPYGVEGTTDARWVLLDFVDVVVHIFDPPSRQIYDLELLWGDAPRLAWQQP